MTHTNTSVLQQHGYQTLELEFPELEIPVLSANQRQGDVLLLKITKTIDGGRPLGKGVEVVRSEQGSNTHTLHGDGVWLANDRAVDAEVLVQGWLTVPDGGEAFLIHSQEHNAIGIGAGTYEIRRQREFAGEWRRVSD